MYRMYVKMQNITNLPYASATRTTGRITVNPTSSQDQPGKKKIPAWFHCVTTRRTNTLSHTLWKMLTATVTRHISPPRDHTHALTHVKRPANCPARRTLSDWRRTQATARGHSGCACSWTTRCSIPLSHYDRESHILVNVSLRDCYGDGW